MDKKEMTKLVSDAMENGVELGLARGFGVCAVSLGICGIAFLLKACYDITKFNRKYPNWDDGWEDSLNE